MRVQSRNDKIYVCVLIDYYFRYAFTIFLSSKDETYNEVVALLKQP